jgi:CheY-like chemotaxis protein
MKKILVIEDEEIILNNTIELLELENFEAIGAENGIIGVQMTLEQKPDLILCDIRMPELDGYSVLEHLRQNPETAAIPFIFMSAKANKDEIQAAEELGVAYLLKPFGIKEMFELIRELLDD